MSTPLTDGINALTAYANEVTGASDTTLSDAVESLVAGYGVSSIKTSTLTIPANTLDRANTIAQFFREEFECPPCFLEITLVENPNTDNQFVSYLYNKNDAKPYDVVATRYRTSTNKAASFVWADPGYALFVVEGTHYNVKYII